MGRLAVDRKLTPEKTIQAPLCPGSSSRIRTAIAIAIAAALCCILPAIGQPLRPQLTSARSSQKDPLAVPVTSIADIRKIFNDVPDQHRVKIVGTVIARFPHQGVYLTDGSGGLYAESQDSLLIR